MQQTEANKGKSNGKGLAQVEGRRFTAKDFVELSVLCTYIVQKRGGATFEDVLEVIEGDLNSKVHSSTLSKVLEALRDRGILAEKHGADGRSYKMKKIQFNCDVEIAHVRDLIPALQDDTAGIAIKQAIEGEKKATKKRKYPKTWADYTVEIELLSPWLGAQPILDNPYLLHLYHAEAAKAYANTIPKNIDPKCTPLVFERSVDGALVIHAACVRGFFSTHIRSAGLSPYAIDHFYFRPIHVRPEKLFTTKLPIIDPNAQRGQARGKGMGFYEVIPAGTRITFEFSAPTVNFISPAKMEDWLKRVLARPSSSMSPARGRQYGAAKLISLKFDKWPEIADEPDAEDGGESEVN